MLGERCTREAAPLKLGVGERGQLLVERGGLVVVGARLNTRGQVRCKRGAGDHSRDIEWAVSVGLGRFACAVMASALPGLARKNFHWPMTGVRLRWLKLDAGVVPAAPLGVGVVFGGAGPSRDGNREQRPETKRRGSV